MSSRNQYVAVTPVRDEVEHIDQTIQSMQAQTVLPLCWVVVDDGSTDGTSEKLDHWASTLPWMRVLHRRNRGFRANGSGVMEAFHAGLQALSNDALAWDFLVKLDGDMSFKADYFERCLWHFDQDPLLGVGGGTVYRRTSSGLVVDAVGDPPFHVRGATKIYRRACWENITPLLRTPGWDTVDEVKANLLGWHTKTFAELCLVQHKPTGGADGRWRNAFKNGRANYITGYHPLFMLAKCIRRAIKNPLSSEAFGLLVGYCVSFAKGESQIDDKQMIQYLRHQQIRRLLARRSIYG